MLKEDATLGCISPQMAVRISSAWRANCSASSNRLRRLDNQANILFGGRQANVLDGLGADFAQIEPGEYAALVERLAAHFVEAYGAPSLDAARPVAEDELRFMAEMCEDHDPNTLLVVQRDLVEAGVSESFRAIKPQEASLDMVAIHGDVEDS